MNKIISLLFALGILASCGQGRNKIHDAADMEFKPVSVSEFISDAGPFVDEAVKISGTVVHVCRHGGQRLFIVGEDGEDRIRITTGEDIAEFDIALEGETIEVTGIVKELIIDETYLAQWEAEIVEGSRHELGEGHEGGVGHGDNHGDADADQDTTPPLEEQLSNIQKVRDELAESGKDHLSDYWIETIVLKVIKE